MPSTAAGGVHEGGSIGIPSIVLAPPGDLTDDRAVSGASAKGGERIIIVLSFESAGSVPSDPSTALWRDPDDCEFDAIGRSDGRCAGGAADPAGGSDAQDAELTPTSKASRVPHRPQNRESGVFEVPQFGQTLKSVIRTGPWFAYEVLRA